jgi:hypothetical protein
MQTSKRIGGGEKKGCSGSVEISSGGRPSSAANVYSSALFGVQTVSEEMRQVVK